MAFPWSYKNLKLTYKQLFMESKWHLKFFCRKSLGVLAPLLFLLSIPSHLSSTRVAPSLHPGTFSASPSHHMVRSSRSMTGLRFLSPNYVEEQHHVGFMSESQILAQKEDPEYVWRQKAFFQLDVELNCILKISKIKKYF